MRIYFLPLLVSAVLSADPINPITSDLPQKSEAREIGQQNSLDTLISITEKSLDAQKRLKEMIAKFEVLQARYLLNTDNTELLIQLAKQASYIHNDIETYRLEENFSPEFLKELKLFAQVAKKRSLPRVR